ncbi:hypothetical protein BD410DRAFT_787512 [Rickenella mellea]|uniref:RRM domain-containing protein n=1 Tax=Rickenella mellea TaxID=50990 RepID=A0A4Y7Q798_9AGAM|nr:hypothetical protein BD410DRAFT_787512 [Rickenella mellea]
MSTYSVNVSNLAPSTTEAQLHDFFTFCGKIVSIDFKESSKSAVVHFEKSSAAKTALMLNGGTLDGSQLTVESDIVHPEDGDGPHPDGAPFHQSDKPRAGIAAEYLAKGYVLSDQVLQRAIEIDNKQGISKRFLSYMKGLDSSIGSRAVGPDQTISGKVHSTLTDIDQKKGISKTATDYYSKAVASSFGQKVLAFYTTTSKQILDIHEEARRMANVQKNNGNTQSASEPGIQTTTNTVPHPSDVPPATTTTGV